MIEIKDVSFQYKDAKSTALKKLNLTIKDGEFVGIIGNSGAGKSTFTYTLSGIVPHHFSGDFYGMVSVNGMDTCEVKMEDLAKYVGEVFQDIDSQMVSSVVEDEILFGMENFGVPHDEIGKRLEKVLKMLDIEELKYRQISSLSGGQKQKVAIASILALESQIIVLDEPTGELDPESTVTIFEILKQLNEQYGKTIVIVEQKIMLLCQYAKRILVMNEGEICFDGTTQEMVNQVSLFENLGISVPRVTKLGTVLREKGKYQGEIPVDLDGAEKMVKEVLHVTV